jgi:hypothetical protein
MDLSGHVFKTTLYESVVGSIVVETEVLGDGSIYTSMFVVYPDGLADEIFTVKEGFEMLELTVN